MDACQANHNQVTVVTSNSAQKELIANILNRSAHSLRFVDHVSQVNTLIHKTSDVVVCHQVSSSTPKPEIPKRLGDERIIVLSDSKDEQRIVQALEQGAHHYFNINESGRVLGVRVEAAMRRDYAQFKSQSEFFPYKFCAVKRQVEVSGKRVQLNPREFDCAHYLFTHCNRIIEVEELMVSVWALPPDVDTRRIDTAMSRLRKKLALNTREHGWFLNRVRGIGFQLTNEAA